MNHCGMGATPHSRYKGGITVNRTASPKNIASEIKPRLAVTIHGLLSILVQHFVRNRFGKKNGVRDIWARNNSSEAREKMRNVRPLQ